MVNIYKSKLNLEDRRILKTKDDQFVTGTYEDHQQSLMLTDNPNLAWEFEKGAEAYQAKDQYEKHFKCKLEVVHLLDYQRYS